MIGYIGHHLHKKHHGFTLIETLIAIIVISILATISVVAYNGMQQKAYDAKVDATLNQIEKGIKAYVIKGNNLRLRHYVVNDFYAQPGGGHTDAGIAIYSGGGLGRELNEKNILSGNFQDPLKQHGPKRDLSLKNNIRIIHCGKKKLFVVIEAYSGTKESDFNQKRRALNCEYRTELDWRAENNLPPPSAWGTASGNYRVQPNYKIAEIDL